MPTNKELAQMRHRKLIDEYNRLSAIQEYGVQKYSHTWIVAHLEQKCYYKQSYIEQLLKKKV